MNDIKTNISYSGEASVSLKVGEKVIKFNKHNSGLPNLFRLIASALSGRDVRKDAPHSIDIRYAINKKNGVSEESWCSCLVNPQPLSQLKYMLLDGSWVTSACATIPYSAFIFTSIGAINASSFRLYLMSKDSDLAYIELNPTELNTITPGSQAVVEWLLKVNNQK